jgi:hypothetical protein
MVPPELAIALSAAIDGPHPHEEPDLAKEVIEDSYIERMIFFAGFLE